MPNTDHLVLVLDLSDRHLPENLRYANLNEYGWLTADTLTYGHLVVVPEQPDEEQAQAEELIPDELLTVLRYAADHDCAYVMFDQSGPVCPDLPTFA